MARTSVPGLLGVATVVAIVFALAGVEEPAPRAACAPVGPQSDGILDVLEHFVTATDTGSLAERKLIGIGTVDPASVRLVTSDSICAIASAKLDTLLGDGLANHDVYVVTLGRRFVVDDPANDSHWRPS